MKLRRANVQDATAPILYMVLRRPPFIQGVDCQPLAFRVCRKNQMKEQTTTLTQNLGTFIKSCCGCLQPQPTGALRYGDAVCCRAVKGCNWDDFAGLGYLLMDVASF